MYVYRFEHTSNRLWSGERVRVDLHLRVFSQLSPEATRARISKIDVVGFPRSLSLPTLLRLYPCRTIQAVSPTCELRLVSSQGPKKERFISGGAWNLRTPLFPSAVASRHQGLIKKPHPDRLANYPNRIEAH